MYHFGSHDVFQSQGGGAGPYGDAAANYADMILVGGSSSSSNLEENLKLLGFASSMGGAADGHHHLVQANSSYAQYFDPTTIGILSAADHHHNLVHSHGAALVFDEMPAEINSTTFYNQAAAMGMDLISNNQPSVLRNMLSSLENNGSGSMMNHVDMIKQGGVKRKKRSTLLQRDEEVDEAGSQKNEKRRRERFTKKFDYLRSLIPNTTKPDRASVIADTIDYINELLRTIKELKILVEKKRIKMARNRRSGDQAAGDMESSSMIPLMDEAAASKGGVLMQLRSSWLQRKTKETFVDVRIVEDEVYIKLTQRRKINCLLLLSKVLDDLHLELLYLSFGNIGDSHIFMFDTKINEGSSVYASAVANKVIEVMEVTCSSF